MGGDQGEGEVSESRVHVKGSALEARFRWTTEMHGHAGIDRLLRALPPEDRAMYEHVILPSSWYPFGAFVRVNEAIDRTFGAGDLALVREVARWSADANLTTLYRFFYQLGSVGFILSMGSRLWRLNYDAGALEVETRGQEVTLRIADFPEPHRVHCVAVMAWCGRSAEISGAKEVTGEERSCRVHGDDRCEFHMSWR